MGRSFGLTAFILGIISLPTNITLGILHFYMVLLIVGWLIPFIAIFLGIIGMALDDSKGLALTGVIFGIIALVSGLSIRTVVS